jgi:hypothetical protein
MLCLWRCFVIGEEFLLNQVLGFLGTQYGLSCFIKIRMTFNENSDIKSYINLFMEIYSSSVYYL